MGMTDKQFDSFKIQLLRRLERAQAEIKEYNTSPELDLLIEDFRNELNKVSE